MTLTEAEAMARWCPFARTFWAGGNEQPVTVNRNTGGAPDSDCRCIASECMAWRWRAAPRRRVFVTWEGKPEEEWAWDPTGATGYERAVVRYEKAGAGKGYCGLAGV